MLPVAPDRSKLPLQLLRLRVGAVAVAPLRILHQLFDVLPLLSVAAHTLRSGMFTVGAGHSLVKHAGWR